MIAALGVSACAPLNKDQCKTANWQQLGYQAGLKGREATRFEDERKACADHHIEADATGWKLGYTQGLGVYCTAGHGYDVGRHGENYGDVCPPESDAKFRPAYEDGRHVAKIVSAFKDRRSRMDDIGQRLQDDDQRARAYVDQVRDGAPPPANPPQLMDKYQRRELEGEYDQLRRELNQIRHDFERTDGDLSSRYAVPVMSIDGN